MKRIFHNRDGVHYVASHIKNKRYSLQVREKVASSGKNVEFMRFAGGCDAAHTAYGHIVYRSVVAGSPTTFIKKRSRAFTPGFLRQFLPELLAARLSELRRLNHQCRIAEKRPAENDVSCMRIIDGKRLLRFKHRLSERDTRGQHS